MSLRQVCGRASGAIDVRKGKGGKRKHFLGKSEWKWCVEL